MTFTWEEQRRHIHEEVNTFFNAKVDIAPRAMSCLQVPALDDEFTDEGWNSGADITVLESLLRSSPACSTILFKAGVMLEQIEFPRTRAQPTKLMENTLEWLFCGVEVTKLTPTARAVQKSGLLSEVDLMIASLEASQCGSEANSFGTEIYTAAGYKPISVRGGGDPEWSAVDEHLRSITDRVRELTKADPAHALVQFVLFEDRDRKIRVRPFGATDISRLSLVSPAVDGQPYVFRGGVFQPIDALMPDLTFEVLAELEDLINSVSASEADFQQFFERHPSLLTAFDFGRAHPQPILYKEDGGRLIPDFFLEKIDSGWDVIVDLKRAYDDMVTRRRNRVYFKQHVQNAIAQLRFYREWFDSPLNRRDFSDSYGVTTFHPKMVIVIGRNHHFIDDVERIRLLEGIPNNLELWTYDDVYNRAKRYLDFALEVASRRNKHPLDGFKLPDKS